MVCLLLGPAALTSSTSCWREKRCVDCNNREARTCEPGARRKREDDLSWLDIECRWKEGVDWVDRVVGGTKAVADDTPRLNVAIIAHAALPSLILILCCVRCGSCHESVNKTGLRLVLWHRRREQGMLMCLSITTMDAMSMIFEVFARDPEPW